MVRQICRTDLYRGREASLPIGSTLYSPQLHWRLQTARRGKTSIASGAPARRWPPRAASANPSPAPACRSEAEVPNTPRDPRLCAGHGERQTHTATARQDPRSGSLICRTWQSQAGSPPPVQTAGVRGVSLICPGRPHKRSGSPPTKGSIVKEPLFVGGACVGEVDKG